MNPQSVTNVLTRSPKAQILIISLCVLMMASWAFVLWNRNNQRQEQNELARQFYTLQETKKQMRSNYDASLALLDSITGTISEDEKELATRNQKIDELDKELSAMLRQVSISRKERDRAKLLIGQLNTQLESLRTEIARLTSANQLLSEEMSALLNERDEFRLDKEKLEIETNELQTRINVASTLNTSSIVITPLVSGKGRSDKVASKPSKANKYMLAFDVDNRIIQPGSTNIYIIVQDPEGNIIKMHSDSTGVFSTTDNQQQPFTAVLGVEVKTGAKRHIEFCWDKPAGVKKGIYYVGIYHNGFKIGEASTKSS
jgi:hypothetical protein